MARDHPKFSIPNYGRQKRVKNRWRKPRGVDSKKRIHLAKMGASPEIGWRSPRVGRGLHPSGNVEIFIRNMNDLAKVGEKQKNTVLRLAAKLGKRKRIMILAKAKELGVRVLNQFKME